jgi:hypothetical protein
LLHGALAVAKGILAMPIPATDDKNFGKVLQLKQQVAQSIFTTTARVRDQLLRPAQDDGFSKVQAAIKKAQSNDDAVVEEVIEVEEVIDIFS